MKVNGNIVLLIKHNGKRVEVGDVYTFSCKYGLANYEVIKITKKAKWDVAELESFELLNDY